MSSVDLITTLVKVLVVFGILFLTLKGLARVQGNRGRARVRTRTGAQPLARRPVEIIDQTRLHRSASVVTIRLGERTVALAVTESRVTDLGEVVLELDETDEQPTAHMVSSSGSFLSHALDALRERTVRS